MIICKIVYEIVINLRFKGLLLLKLIINQGYRRKGKGMVHEIVFDPLHNLFLKQIKLQTINIKYQKIFINYQQ